MKRSEWSQKRHMAIRVPQPSVLKILQKEQTNEKVAVGEVAAQGEKQKAVLADFAIRPSFPNRVEGHRSTEPDLLEMEAIRQEAVNYTRPYCGDEGRGM